MHEPPHRIKAAHEVWEIILRYRWRLIVPAFVVAGLTLAVSLTLPRKYKAEAVFERTTNLVMQQMHQRGAAQDYVDPMRSLAQQIVGDRAVASLVDELTPKLRGLGVIHNPRDAKALEARIHRQTTIHREISTGQLDRIRVQYIGDHPRAAMLIANGLVRQYIDAQRELMHQRLHESTTFFQKQLGAAKTSARSLEDQLLGYEIKHAQLLPGNPNNVQIQVTDLREQIRQLENARDHTAKRIAGVQKKLAQEPKTLTDQVQVPNPQLADLKNHQKKLQSELMVDLNQKKMRPTHPVVIALKQRIASLDEQIAQAAPVDTTRRTPNPKRAAMQGRLAELQSDEQATEQQLASLNEQLKAKAAVTAALYPVRSAFVHLKQQVDDANHQVEFWEDNLKRISLSSMAQSDDRGVSLNFVKPAANIEQPVSPRLDQVLAAAIILGLGAGGLNVFLAYRGDERFSRGEQVATALDLPLLGSVGEVVTGRYRRLRLMRNLILVPASAGAMALVLAVLVGAVYLNLQRPQLFAKIKGQTVQMIHQNHLETPGAPS